MSFASQRPEMADVSEPNVVEMPRRGFLRVAITRLAGLRELWETPTFRSVFIAAAAFAVLVALVIGLTFVAVTRAMTAENLRSLGAEARVAAEVVRQTSFERASAILEAERRADPRLAFLLVDGNGRRYESAFPRNIGATLLGRSRDVPHAISQSDERSDLGGSELHAAVLVPAAENGAVLLARPMRGVSELSRQMFWTLVLSTLLIAASALALGLFAASRMARRVSEINAIGRNVMAGDLSQRLPVSRVNDELDQLAGTVNAMLGRIEELVAGVRHVSDSLAHDLRTPLSRLRTRAETVLREATTIDEARDGLARTIEDADRLIRTFNEMLLAGRLDAGAQDLGATPFDAVALADDIAEFYTPVAEDEGAVIVRNGVAGPVLVAGSRQLMGQALTNLIENALKYGCPTTPGGRFVVTLDVSVPTAGQTVEISVADGGRGIAEADRARVVQRFVRLDESRSTPGTGLGLSLVGAIARAHHGALVLTDNHPGLRCSLRLPLLAVKD